jgi:NAD(P)-dependent dehydrogenase (short-subunit alcohol dehydrogenase family)
MDQIKGKTAFITGGARGIGLGIARAIAREGGKLALIDIDEPSLNAARAELSKSTAVETFILDVRDREAYARIADEAEAKLGPISILCNNAGVAGAADVTRMTYALWDWVIGINLNGVINGIQTFVPRMIERKTVAHVVNTASGAGLVASGAGFLYTTSKFAVVGLSESLRMELEAHGIGVSVLCPGPVATGIIEHSVAPGASAEALTPEQIAERKKRLAVASAFLAAGVAPDEVGNMVVSAIKANRLHIITDRLIEPFVESRAKAILDAMPPRS